MPSTTITPPTRAKRLPAATGDQVARRPFGGPGLVLAVILASQLMVVLDATIVNVALPHIQESLGFSSANLSWVLNAYILTFGGLLLLGARAGDLLGRRRTFLIGIAAFSASSLAGGFAVAGWQLLAARALQGAGAALAAPSSLALLTTTFPAGPARLRAIGLFTTVSAAGGAVGLVAGGLLTELVSWRWVMFVNVPIGVAVFVIGRLVLVETERRHGRFDVVGAITSTFGMGAIVLGLVEAGTNGWTSVHTVAPLLAGLVLLAIFVWNERRVAEPILPMRLVRHPRRNAANLARGLVYAGMYGVFFFLTQFLQDVQGYSPLRAGVSFLPLPAAVFVFSQLTSRVLVHRLPTKTLMLLGITTTTLGLALSSQLHAGSTYAQVIVNLILIGAGTGISLVSLTAASLDGVAPHDAGAASGLVNVVQQLGAALGVAVLVTVFGSVTGHVQLVSRTAAAAGARTTLIVHGLDTVFGVGSLFALTAFVTVAVMIRRVVEPVLELRPALADDDEPELAILDGAA